MSKNYFSNENIHALLSSNLFEKIDQDELTTILTCLDPKISTFSKHDYLAIEGEHLRKFGLVMDGKVALTKLSREGKRIILAILEKGNVFGISTVFTSQKTWPSTAEAHQACKVLWISCGKAAAHLTSHEQLMKNTLRIISEELMLMFDRFENLSLKSPREKIINYLHSNFDASNGILKLPLNREELADYLNISRPSLSRELCKLRDEGLIKFHKSIIKIEDASRLFCNPDKENIV
jgi:CRP-like cAMP-binding protein